MPGMKARLTGGRVRARLVGALPGAGVVGGRGVPVRRRHRLAPPGHERAGARGQPAAGARDRTRRQAAAAPCPGRPCAPTRGTGWRYSGCRSCPGSCWSNGMDEHGHVEDDARPPRRRSRGRDPAAAHGQLGPGGGLGDRPRRRLLHHGDGAAGTRVGVRAVPGVPAGARHGGAACLRRLEPVRRAGPAAARRQPGRAAVGPRRHRRRR